MINGEVFAFLLAQVEESRAAYRQAKERLAMIARKTRSTGYSPGGFELLRHFVTAETSALKSYHDAMMRLNRYLLDGTIPGEVSAALEKMKRRVQHG